MEWKRTEATRLLCAAAYQDWAFRDAVIAGLSKSGCNALAVSLGVDLVPVLKHCYAARRRKDVRDIAVAACVVAALLAGYLSGSTSLLLQALLAAYVVVVVIVGVDRWTTDFGIVAGRLSESAFDPDAAPAIADQIVGDTLSVAEELSASNVSVYSGFVPFSICGVSVGGWSFALEVEKPKESTRGGSQEIVNFTVPEMYGFVESALVKLDIPGLSVSDHLFVHGCDVRRDRRLLPDRFRRPVLRVAPELLREFVGLSSPDVRHFKWIRVIGWSGELIFSILLNFSRLGTKLHVEADYYLLTPLRKEFHDADRIVQQPGLRRAAAHLADVPVMALVLGMASPFILAAKPLRGLLRAYDETRTRRRMASDPQYDYGAAMSIRNWVSASGYHHYFQRVDKEKYVKVLERQILDAILEFLDSKNIDTSDLKDRQTTILNSGVIISGGRIDAQNLAVGSGSTAQSSSRKRGKGKANAFAASSQE